MRRRVKWLKHFLLGFYRMSRSATRQVNEFVRIYINVQCFYYIKLPLDLLYKSGVLLSYTIFVLLEARFHHEVVIIWSTLFQISIVRFKDFKIDIAGGRENVFKKQRNVASYALKPRHVEGPLLTCEQLFVKHHILTGDKKLINDSEVMLCSWWD